MDPDDDNSHLTLDDIKTEFYLNDQLAESQKADSDSCDTFTILINSQ